MSVVENKYEIKSTIVSSEDSRNTYEIKREFGEFISEKKVLIFTLYPTIDTSNVHALDSSWLHLQNHLPDLEIGTVRMMYLFSSIWEGKPSVSSLEVDEENIAYIEKVLKDKDFDSIIVAWGSSYKKNKIANESKLRILELIKKAKIMNVLQLFADGVITTNTSAVHPLFLGLRGKGEWGTTEYVVDEAIKECQERLENKTKGED